MKTFASSNSGITLNSRAFTLLLVASISSSSLFRVASISEATTIFSISSLNESLASSIYGEDALNERDKQLLDFSGVFENKFLRQTRDEDRSIDETLDLCWTLMSSIDTKYLVRLDQKWIEKYHPDNK